MIRRLMIVDDSLSFRKSMTFLLRSIEGIQLVGEFEDGMDALTNIPILSPDIVLVDVLMPGMDGITLTRFIRQFYPDIQIIAITGSMNSQVAQRVLDAGASRVVFKGQSIVNILRALSPVGART